MSDPLTDLSDLTDGLVEHLDALEEALLEWSRA